MDTWFLHNSKGLIKRAYRENSPKAHRSGPCGISFVFVVNTLFCWLERFWSSMVLSLGQRSPFRKMRNLLLGTLFCTLFMVDVGFGKGSFFQISTTNAPVGYWIWAGIRPDERTRSSVLYIYQGALRSNGKRTEYERLGLFPHPLQNKIYLVYRLMGESTPTEILKLFEVNAALWKRHHVEVVGMQLDFDSATSKLLSYSNFLHEVRAGLSSHYKLSVTGLGDWVMSGDKEILHKIEKNTDEIVFQLYQGRKHLSNIENYIDGLTRLNMPFKVGLLEHESPDRYIKKLQENTHFRGAILFIQNHHKKDHDI